MATKKKQKEHNLNRDCYLIYGADPQTEKYFHSVYAARDYVRDFSMTITEPLFLRDATNTSYDITPLLKNDTL